MGMDDYDTCQVRQTVLTIMKNVFIYYADYFFLLQPLHFSTACRCLYLIAILLNVLSQCFQIQGEKGF